MFLDLSLKSKQMQNLLERFGRLRWHKFVFLSSNSGRRYFFFLCGTTGVGALAAGSSFAFVSFVWTMVSRFCTVQ